MAIATTPKKVTRTSITGDMIYNGLTEASKTDLKDRLKGDGGFIEATSPIIIEMSKETYTVPTDSTGLTAQGSLDEAFTIISVKRGNTNVEDFYLDIDNLANFEIDDSNPHRINSLSFSDDFANCTIEVKRKRYK